MTNILPIEISSQILRDKGSEFATNNFDSPLMREFETISIEQENATYGPAIAFVLDTTLTMLEHPEAVIPDESSERGKLANEVLVDDVIATMIASKALAHGHLHKRGRLSRFALKEEQAKWESFGGDDLEILSVAPLMDTYKVVVNAAERLRSEGFEDPLSIVLASRSLVNVAKVSKNNIFDLFESFGGSVRPDQFEIVDSDGEVEIIFGDEVAQAIVENGPAIGALGCPAGRVKVGEKSMTEVYWDRITSYLLAPPSEQ